MNPRDDAGFLEYAESLVSEGANEPRDLEAGLRERYPRASVRPRELSSERITVWYVYREGHWVPVDAAREERA